MVVDKSKISFRLGFFPTYEINQALKSLLSLINETDFYSLIRKTRRIEMQKNK